MGPTHRLAIDLGTCHTVAVVRRGDEAPRPLLFDGSPLLSSGIYADESGALSVGSDAERLSQLAPSRFEPYPKRRVDEGSVLLGESETTVVEMLAALLRRVAAEALQSGVNPVGATVLTCPADWGGQRRGVLLAAARAANLGPVELVDEPIAAATYCVRVLGHQIAPLQCLAVFDFGGGTLDVSVVRREFDGLRVLAVGGLDDLGGVDVDAALVGHLGQLIELRAPEVWHRLSAPDGAGALRDRRALWNEVRSAKEMLSRAASAPVHVPGTENALHLTRDELERVAGPLIDRAVDETRRVLQRAGVGNSQLAGIFLVGGSSRIPLVSSRLHARFDVAPTVPEQPELPVAYGALIAVDGQAAPSPARYGTPTSPISGSPISGSPISGGVPVSGSPMSPAGSYPPGPGAPPVPSTTSFPPIQLSPPGPARQGFPAAAIQASPAGPTPGAPPGLPQLVYAPRPLPRPAPPRPKWRRYAILAVVVVVLAGCGWGGWNVIKGRVDSIRGATGLGNGNGGNGNGGSGNAGSNGGGAATGLKPGTPITIPGEGELATTAGNGAVYTASVGIGKIDVTGYAATGVQTWTASVAAEPKDVRLTVVGGLLLVDGGSASTHNGDDIRAVLDAKTGASKWLSAWENRIDLFYDGTDAIVEVRSSPSSLQRVDLLTGKARWTHAGAKTFYINDNRRAKVALDWPRQGLIAGVPSFTSFSRVTPFQESLGAEPGVAVHLDAEGKGSVIDLRTGAAKASAGLPLDPEKWIVFGGALIGVVTGKNNVVAAYNLQGLTKLWEFRRPGGSAIDQVRPCAERLVCVKSQASGGDYSLDAVDVGNGQAKWTKKYKDEPLWYVVGGELLFGTGAFTQLEKPSVLDRASGDKRFDVGANLQSPYGEAARGNRVALMSTKLTGTSLLWRVSVAEVGTGKVIGTADVGSDLLQDVAISDDTVAVTDKKNRMVFRFAIPGPG